MKAGKEKVLQAVAIPCASWHCGSWTEAGMGCPPPKQDAVVAFFMPLHWVGVGG